MQVLSRLFFIVVSSIKFIQTTRTSNDYDEVIDKNIQQVIYLKEMDNAISL